MIDNIKVLARENGLCVTVYKHEGRRMYFAKNSNGELLNDGESMFLNELLEEIRQQKRENSTAATVESSM